MKLTTMTQLTLDGVAQGNGGSSEEDLRQGFDRGGWAKGAGDDATRDFIAETYQRADAFLFGRRTYELFVESWATVPELITHPVGAALNSKPKYVASRTLTRADWGNTTILDGDLASAIRDLKSSSQGELQVHGSATLVRWLLENDLVDELNFLIVPVVLGQGARLFPQSGPRIPLELVSSRADSKGVLIQAYRPAKSPE